jgi:large subunit ribosomal protein L24
MARSIRKGDEVMVIGGKDRGKTGTVQRGRPEAHASTSRPEHDQAPQRPQTLRDTQRQPDVEGGIIEREGAIHLSNVALVDPKDGKPTPGRHHQPGRRAQARGAALGDGDRLMADVPARLKERYESELRPQLVNRFGYTSPMQAPRIEKVT